MAMIFQFYFFLLIKIKKKTNKNIQFIDPIRKGNYSSRLSHSCDPNCGTICSIANGQYYVGMYALRDIKHGEELTFDYCSVKLFYFILFI